MPVCGIVGYVGHRQAVEVLLEGLRRLEYRGYDSAGVAVVNHRLQVVKTAGRLPRLEAMVASRPGVDGFVGIGHTRWATHGAPTDTNAHPHLDCHGRIGVVHNGIIDNFAELKEQLAARGHRFRSDTDTEVVAHLLEELYRGDLAACVRQAAARLRGSWALAVVSSDEPGVVVLARHDSPLVVGVGDGELLAGSDPAAVLRWTRRMVYLHNGDVARLSQEGIQVWDGSGRPVLRPEQEFPWDARAAERGGYPHFMLKEIHEQPDAVQNTLHGRIRADRLEVDLQDAGVDRAWLSGFQRVMVVACGTAWHAGLAGQGLLEDALGRPVWVELGSEFRHRPHRVDERTLTVVVSQSGETADTLAALREARRRGSPVLAIVNVEGSTIAREADRVLYTRAGPEVAVASTKAYTAQVVALALLSALAAGGEVERRRVQELLQLPQRLRQVLEQEPRIREVAVQLAASEHAFYIGRGLDWAVAMEGALKMKEISYIHAEAYAAGELKHGTLALIEEGRPVVALSTQRALQAKMLGNIQEVKARGARVVGVTLKEPERVAAMEKVCDAVLAVPPVSEELAPAVAVVPLQLLAYHAAVARGCDVDRPRNLAKSVTVE